MPRIHVMPMPRTGPKEQHYATPVERVYYEWDKALSENNANALLELYAPDAVIESPLIPHLLGKEEGVCSGREEMRPFFEAVAKRKPPARQYYRTGYLTDGKRLIFEYPREGPRGEQMDFIQSMEINEAGLIQRHCVYWGWYGVGMMERDEYHR